MVMSLEEGQCEKVCVGLIDSARSVQEPADTPVCTTVRLQLS
jgi:hypothetical protein